MRIKDDLKIESIFKASLCIIQKTGFGGITMAKIAIGTLYIYIKSATELLIIKSINCVRNAYTVD